MCVSNLPMWSVTAVRSLYCDTVYECCCCYCWFTFQHSVHQYSLWFTSHTVSPHTGWPKKIGTIVLYALTVPDINRFSKLFHCQNQEKICNNTITKDPTTPQVCRYTTLWNVKCMSQSFNDRAIGQWRRGLSASSSIDREFEFYEFFSFLKFNEFYEFFFRWKKFGKNS